METWKEIENTNGMYYVSDLGNVKKLGGKQFKRNGTNLKLCEINSGYLIAKMYVNHKHIQRTVHRSAPVRRAAISESPDTAFR